jgi:hypothetical protein
MIDTKYATQWESIDRDLRRSLERMEALMDETRRELGDAEDEDKRRRLGLLAVELKQKMDEIRSIGLWGKSSVG